MADTARHNLFITPEVTYGTTPASATYEDVRHVGTTLGLSKESFQSEELNEDRSIRHFRHGVKNVAGDISFELSYGTFDTLLEAALGGTWAADVLKAGTVRRSFTALRHFSDLLAADKPFHIFTGCEVNALNLTIPASGIITGSFGIMGKDLTLAQDTSGLGTPVFGSPTATSPMDSFTGSIDESGSAVNVVTEVSLSLANGLAVRNVIGSDTTLQPSIGRSNLTGTVNAFFENAVIMEKFLNETESTLDITIEDTAGNQYVLNLPRIKYNGGQPDTSGEGPVEINFPLQALYDTTAGSNLVITRIAV